MSKPPPADHAFGQFAATISFDAMRVAFGYAPRNHDVDTICRWLRHVSQHCGTEKPPSPPSPSQPFPERGDPT